MMDTFHACFTCKKPLIVILSRTPSNPSVDLRSSKLFLPDELMAVF
jgi:hypothetical protein